MAHKVGDTVVPKMGPHKGHPHTVIHVHDDGKINIRPKGLTGKRNRYRMGAVTAKPEDVATHGMKESTVCPTCGCESCICKVKLSEDHVKVGDKIHAGFGAKGGAGYRGTVKKMDGNGHVHIELDKDAQEKFGPRTIIAPHHHVTKESVDEDYTAMKGKESFMKKKPLDVKYDPRWHVMSHGKTMERPTKESVIYEDEHAAAHELKTHAENNAHLYKSSHVPIAKNLERKFKKGTYDHEKAKKLWKYHADRAADSYAKEHGSPGQKGHHLFSVSDRKKSAEMMAHDHHEEMKAGNFHTEEAKLKDACWKGYEAIGFKMKDGKKVPNCVPVKEEKIHEQTPAGGFGSDTAGVTSGGNVSTSTVSGPDTKPKGTRKDEIIKQAVKSVQDKQKKKISKKDGFDPEPEAQPLVFTAQI